MTKPNWFNIHPTTTELEIREHAIAAITAPQPSTLSRQTASVLASIYGSSLIYNDPCYDVKYAPYYSVTYVPVNRGDWIDKKDADAIKASTPLPGRFPIKYRRGVAMVEYVLWQKETYTRISKHGKETHVAKGRKTREQCIVLANSNM